MAFQEIMIAPVGADTMAEAIRMGSEVYQQLKKVITRKFGASGLQFIYQVTSRVSADP